ncbi:MAG: hypothetical protein DKINENOH_05433 [bacterium]|nr:hypothetical protein [bacterium]
MFTLDTSILVYAHNEASPFHEQAAAFVKQALAERDEQGRHVAGIAAQV